MRKPEAASAAASKALAADRGDTPVELVCLALVVAVIALGLRIASIW